MKIEIITAGEDTATRPAPLVLVHGAWHGAWCWQDHFIPYFVRAGYAVHALSFRGHGGSEGRDRLRRTSIADYVADLATVTAGLATPPVLMAHSMGGLVAQKYLERHPAAAAVLMASVPPAGALATVLRVARRHPKTLVKMNLTMSLYPLIATPAGAREYLFSDDMPDAQLMSYFPRLQDESYRAFIDMIFSLSRPKQVTVPMLVLGAINDRIFSPAEVAATARAYHIGATLFPDMAHDMMLEKGWKDVADTIVAWLDGQGL